MEEIHLTNMPFGTAPADDGGKILVIGADEGERRYVVPFSKESAERLVKEMGMPNEELADLVGKTIEMATAKEPS